MKKRAMLLFAAILGTGCLLMACGEEKEESEQVENPWVETTEAADVEALVGATFYIPDEAENVTYFIDETDEMAEMQFRMYDIEMYARMKKTDKLEDISGVYYDEWESEEEAEICGCEAITKRTFDEENTIDLCYWYDKDAKITYSLYTAADDLDGFDITAVAEMVYNGQQ